MSVHPHPHRPARGRRIVLGVVAALVLGGTTATTAVGAPPDGDPGPELHPGHGHDPDPDRDREPGDEGR